MPFVLGVRRTPVAERRPEESANITCSHFGDLELAVNWAGRHRRGVVLRPARTRAADGRPGSVRRPAGSSSRLPPAASAAGSTSASCYSDGDGSTTTDQLAEVARRALGDFDHRFRHRVIEARRGYPRPLDKGLEPVSDSLFDVPSGEEPLSAQVPSTHRWRSGCARPRSTRWSASSTCWARPRRCAASSKAPVRHR